MSITTLRLDQIKDQLVNRTGDQIITGFKQFLSNVTVESGFVVSGTLSGDPPFKFVDLSLNHLSLFSGHATGAIDGRTAWMTEIGALSHRIVGGDSNSGIISIAGSGGIIVAPGDIVSLDNTILIRPDLSGLDIGYASNQPAQNLAISGNLYIWQTGNSGTYFNLNSPIRWSNSASGLIQTGTSRLFNNQRQDLASIDFGLSGTESTMILNLVATQTGTAKTYIDTIIDVTGKDTSLGGFRWLYRTGVRSTECSTSTAAESIAMTLDYTGINFYKPPIIAGNGDWKASGLHLYDVVNGNEYVIMISGGELISGAVS